jgi:hypothetical protein
MILNFIYPPNPAVLYSNGSFAAVIDSLTAICKNKLGTLDMVRPIKL